MADYERARLAAVAVVTVEGGAAGDLANLRNELANAVQAVAADQGGAALSQQIKGYMDGNIPFRRAGGDQRDVWERLSNNSKALVTNTLNQQAHINNGGRRKRRRRTRSNSRRLRSVRKLRGGRRRSRTSSKNRSYKRRCSHKRCYRKRRCSLRRRSRRRR